MFGSHWYFFLPTTDFTCPKQQKTFLVLLRVCVCECECECVCVCVVGCVGVYTQDCVFLCMCVYACVCICIYIYKFQQCFSKKRSIYKYNFIYFKIICLPVGIIFWRGLTCWSFARMVTGCAWVRWTQRPATERCHRGPGIGPGLTGPVVVGRKEELSGQSWHLE